MEYPRTTYGRNYILDKGDSMDNIFSSGSLADFGVVGLFMFMLFQYVVKPVVGSLLEKRKNGSNNSNPQPNPDMQKILEILGKCDDRNRPLVWGFCQKEAIDKLTLAVENLTKKLE